MVAKDALGQELAVGDVIFYGIRSGNRVSSHPSVIRSIEVVELGGRRMETKIGVAMFSWRFNYVPNDKSYWEKAVTKGLFYSPENAVKLLPEQYNDEIRELLDAVRLGR